MSLHIGYSEAVYCFINQLKVFRHVTSVHKRHIEIRDIIIVAQMNRSKTYGDTNYHLITLCLKNPLESLATQIKISHHLVTREIHPPRVIVGCVIRIGHQFYSATSAV